MHIEHKSQSSHVRTTDLPTSSSSASHNDVVAQSFRSPSPRPEKSADGEVEALHLALHLPNGAQLYEARAVLRSGERFKGWRAKARRGLGGWSGDFRIYWTESDQAHPFLAS